MQIKYQISGLCSMHRSNETGLCKFGTFDDSFLSYSLFEKRSDQEQWLYLQHKASCMRLWTLLCKQSIAEYIMWCVLSACCAKRGWCTHMSDVYIMFGCTYSCEVLACCVFTRTNFLVSQFQRNNFELDHCLGEGETFMLAEAEHRRQDANEVWSGRRSLAVILTFWGQHTEYYSCITLAFCLSVMSCMSSCCILNTCSLKSWVFSMASAAFCQEIISFSDSSFQ
jgi:hypothetical protein